MSSTDKKSAADPATQKLLEKFWADRLVPAAQAARQRGIKFFELGPDAATPTYYTKHQSAGDPFSQLEPDQWETKLREMWQKDGLPELANLSKPLMQLAEKLKMKDDTTSDVSPYIYVMF